MKLGDTDNIATVFDGEKQYQIPFYQRRYVWDDKNWKRLWEDLLKLPPKHFAGTIITYKLEDNFFEVVDGQQRLITFQIIFSVIRDLWDLKAYSNNKSEKQDIEERKSVVRMHIQRKSKDYRLVLTKRQDQNQFNQVVSGKCWENLFQSKLPEYQKGFKLLSAENNHLILRAYGYFGAQIVENFKCPEDFRELSKVLENFQVINAELDSESGYAPEEIFQIINDTGRMLTDFDYLRNYLFLRTKNILAKNCNDDLCDLYESYWDKFEDWDSEKLNSFFKTFLMAKLGPQKLDSKFFEGKDKNFQPFDCYRKHKETLEDPNQEFIPLLQLSCYADSYNKFHYDLNAPPPVKKHSNINELSNRMRFYDDLKLPRLDWFLLSMIHASELSDVSSVNNSLELYENRCKERSPGISDSDMGRLCDILESYIVRSWLCNSEYKASYNEIYKLFDKFSEKSERVVLLDLENHLFQTDIWPCPEKVKDVLTASAYRNVNLDLVRYILFRIELFRKEYSLEFFDSKSELNQIITGINISICNMKSKTSTRPVCDDIDYRTNEFLSDFNKIWPPQSYRVI